MKVRTRRLRKKRRRQAKLARKGRITVPTLYLLLRAGMAITERTVAAAITKTPLGQRLFASELK